MPSCWLIVRRRRGERPFSFAADMACGARLSKSPLPDLLQVQAMVPPGVGSSRLRPVQGISPSQTRAGQTLNSRRLGGPNPHRVSCRLLRRPLWILRTGTC